MNIKEIARLAGVSTSTVSKIVNQKDDSISSATRERVLKIVKDYNYKPYASSTPNTAKTWLIGILLNSFVSLDTTLDGIVQTAQENNYSTLVYNNYADMEQELKNITALCSRQVDGIIWEPVDKKSLNFLSYFDGLEIPIVTIGLNGGDGTFLLPYEEAAYKITQELILQGHSRIACLITEGRRKVCFINGYKKCLFDHQIKMDDSLIFDDLNNTFIQKVSTHNITGVVSSHYLKAMEFYQLIIRLGYTIPQDVSLISLQNDTIESRFFPRMSEITNFTIRNSDFGSYICSKIVNDIEKRPDFPDSFVQNFHLENRATIGRPYDPLSPQITVVGSINLETHLYAPQLPNCAKTAFLNSSSITAGGRGLTQAVGAAKLGHHVSLIGNVGADVNSDIIYKTLMRYDIGTLGIERLNNEDTGKSYVFVDDYGHSTYSMLPGANSVLSSEDIRQKEKLFENSTYCLIQCDIPLDAISEACVIAKGYGSKIILKPSSYTNIPQKTLADVEILVLDENHLSEMCAEISGVEEQLDSLIRCGVKIIILFLGDQGCNVKTSVSEKRFPPSGLAPLDSTGASDSFVSALAAYLSYGYPLEKAVIIAIYATGLCISRKGGIDSLADQASLEAYIRQERSDLLDVP